MGSKGSASKGSASKEEKQSVAEALTADLQQMVEVAVAEAAKRK
jgi:hypothetical protein